MKINWFSPVPPAKSGISEFSRSVVKELSHRHETTLWVNQDRWDKSLERYCLVKKFSLETIKWNELNRSDFTFFNIGNNPQFHGDIWKVSQLHPGIVILHDFALQHLFLHLFTCDEHRLNNYMSKMEALYGSNCKEIFQNYMCGKLDTDIVAQNYPATDLGIMNCDGIICHSTDITNYLVNTLDAPIIVLPLPFDPTTHPIHPATPKKTSKDSGPPYKLVMFGYMGPNRMISLVLRALQSLSSGSLFTLDIYGTIDRSYEDEVHSLRLDNIVNFHGFVSDSLLDHALSEADLAINLRYPSMGEASYSQLRIWAHALPSLVVNHCWYSELPRNTAAFVRPEHMLSDIQSHLRQFAHRPKRYCKIGKNGWTNLIKHHSVKSYVDNLTAQLPLIASNRGNLQAVHLSKKVNATFRELDLACGYRCENSLYDALELFVANHNLPFLERKSPYGKLINKLKTYIQ